MAHFAQIDDDNIVVNVIVIPDSAAPDPPSDTSQALGREFIANTLRLPGTWLQCSYGSRLRGVFPSPGHIYHPDSDAFSGPKPFPSWTWDSAEATWVPPIPHPEDDHEYNWNEGDQQWIQRPTRPPFQVPPSD